MTRGTAVAQDQWNQSGHPRPEGQRSHRPGKNSQNTGPEDLWELRKRETVDPDDQGDSRHAGREWQWESRTKGHRTKVLKRRRIELEGRWGCKTSASVGTQEQSNSGYSGPEKQQIHRTIGLCAQWIKGPLGTLKRRNSGHTGTGDSRHSGTKEQWEPRTKGHRTKALNRRRIELEGWWGCRTTFSVGTQEQSNSGHTGSEVHRTIGLCAQWTKGPLGTSKWRNSGYTGPGEQ